MTIDLVMDDITPTDDKGKLTDSKHRVKVPDSQ